jgi:VanZ family protein
MVVLLVAQMWPTVPAAPGGLTDKHEHFFFYGILAALALRALAKGEKNSITALTAVSAVAYSSLYGVVVEFCQLLVPTRSYEVIDMIADAMGSALAVGLVWAWVIMRRRSETPDAL